jgi:phosphoribosyl 1,2-cyclic phosphate phosphodiesterase
VKATILGCGPSGGVPLIGGVWGACDPNEPRNRRNRASIVVQHQDTSILVDTSPDLRAQLLSADIKSIDAIIWTHAHADHINGIDDVRALNRLAGRALDGWGSPETLAHIQRSFGYVFEPMAEGRGFYKPALNPREIAGPFVIGAISVMPFDQDHGFSRTLGFRFGPVAYSTDVMQLSDDALDILTGVEIWIVDCFQLGPHRTHANLDQVLTWRDRVRPVLTVLTHMDSSLDYHDLARRLPDNVVPAHDGLIVEAKSQI